MTDFLKSLLTEAYPEPQPTDEPELAPSCEYCGEPSEYLVEVDDSDPSVGYRSTILMCPKCQTKRRLFRRNHY